MSLTAKPPKFECTLCGYESQSQDGIRLHIKNYTNDTHSVENPDEYIEAREHEPLSLTELVQTEFNGCERVERIADHPYWSEQRVLNELTRAAFKNHVKTFTHGDYRFVKVTDE